MRSSAVQCCVKHRAASAWNCAEAQMQDALVYAHPLAVAADSTHARMHAVIEGVALIALDVEAGLELWALAPMERRRREMSVVAAHMVCRLE